jgi:hypothetical protein
MVSFVVCICINPWDISMCVVCGPEVVVSD